MNNLEYDILMKFSFDGDNYIIYTDNTFDDGGNIHLYGARLDEEERLREVEDADIHAVFDIMMKRYREKLLRGEL